METIDAVKLAYKYRAASIEDKGSILKEIRKWNEAMRAQLAKVDDILGETRRWMEEDIQSGKWKKQ